LKWVPQTIGTRQPREEGKAEAQKESAKPTQLFYGSFLTQF
jgi:hypothetical protein